jgi:hypothetical protein
MDDRMWTRIVLLELLGTFAEILRKGLSGKETVSQMYLIRVLPPILDMLGDDRSLVSESAFKTLHRMAIAYGIDKNTQQKMVTEFIAQNADYVIDDLRYRIKFINLYPRAPFVLRTLFQYTTASITTEVISHEMIMGIMEDTMDSIFTGLDEGQSSSTSMEAFFGILNGIVRMVRSSKTDRGKKLVLRILDRIQHYLIVQDLSIQLYIIDIINLSIDLFITDKIAEEDESGDRNIIIAVNKLWPAMISRLRLDIIKKYDKESQQRHQQVRIKLFELIGRLHACFDDYMYGKIIEQVWPLLREQYLSMDKPSFLGRMLQQCISAHEIATKKQKTDEMDVIRMTPDFKLITALLSFLSVLTQSQTSRLMRRMGTTARGKCIDAYDLTSYMLPIFREHVPAEWKQLAETVIRNCSLSDPDSVWYILWKEEKSDKAWSKTCKDLLKSLQ